MEKEKGQIGQGYWIFIRQKIRRQFFFGEKFVLFPTGEKLRYKKHS